MKKTKMQNRRFKNGAVNHVYQRTLNKFNIFYDVADYIAYFTIFCTTARQYDLSILGLCLMVDHIHALIQTNEKHVLSRFISHVSTVFVKEYNSSLGRTGPLFEKRFGSAPKINKKQLISSIIYVANNPVERHLCQSADEYRWNFMAYMTSPQPFSKNLNIRHASRKLKRAIAVVNSLHSQNKYLNHSITAKLLSELIKDETEQLIDYIISLYNVIDYESVLSHFVSYEHLTLSMRSTTGSEYEINEYKDRYSDRVFMDMIEVAKRTGHMTSREVTILEVEAKNSMARHLIDATHASYEQVCKFLHMRFSYRTRYQ